ncbi:hypothetical protein TSAR_007066 [Trichomalopsis sarcophagae]|uniref:Queuine tRNA-ribosyltransferase accessory subunit 2 n=1 Tax=Trichomalopsis sarcophagae TaxID=543379 RepID=A0A232FP34_9HYME|nr:hypothetical protein TSAR_007066 [Trichomalopsis sarcophagae]
MKFCATSLTRCTPRLGTLTEIERLPNLSFETPLLLLYTRRGSVPHLSKDVFKRLTEEQQFLLTSLPSTIFMTDFVKQFESFNDYVSMQEYPFFLSIQDPSETTNAGYQKNQSIAVWSRNGRSTVTPDRYMNIAEIFKPDMYVTLCDGDTDQDSSSKRISKTIERSKVLFEKCLTRHLTSDILKNKGFLGSIEGGYNLQAREKSIKYMEGKPLLGYMIDGLHKNGIEVQNISIDQIKPVIEHSLNLLPMDKLRVLMGCWNPPTILDLVDLGIDVFDSSYSFLMTEQSKALTFLCNDCKHGERSALINLSEKRYVEDFEPICKACSCLTCKNHTKAYINHLIQTKELLAEVLLMIHNTHHYMEFFKAIRQHIKNGTFHEFRNKINVKFSQMIEQS